MSRCDNRSRSSAVSTSTIGASLRAYAAGSLITRWVGEDGLLGNRERELVAVAVEDAAALGRQAHGADPLLHRQRFVVIAFDGLHVHQLEDDCGQCDRHDDEERDEPLVRRRRRAHAGRLAHRSDPQRHGSPGRSSLRTRFPGRSGLRTRLPGRSGLRTACPLRPALLCPLRGLALGLDLRGSALRNRLLRDRLLRGCTLGSDLLRGRLLGGLGSRGAGPWGPGYLAGHAGAGSRSGGGGAGCGSRPSGHVPAPSASAPRPSASSRYRFGDHGCLSRLGFTFFQSRARAAASVSPPSAASRPAGSPGALR